MISVNKQMPFFVQSVPLFKGVLAPVGLEVILRSGHGGMTLLACRQGHTLSLNHPPTDVCARIHSFWMTQIFIYNPSGLFYIILFDRWLTFVCIVGWYRRSSKVETMTLCRPLLVGCIVFHHVIAPYFLF